MHATGDSYVAELEFAASLRVLEPPRTPQGLVLWGEKALTDTGASAHLPSNNTLKLTAGGDVLLLRRGGLSPAAA